MKKFMNYIVFAVFDLLFVGILADLLFVDKKIKYCRMTYLEVKNVVLLPIGLIVFLLLIIGIRKLCKISIDKLNGKKCKLLMLVSFALLFLIQCIYAKLIYFPTRWDAEILRLSSDILASGKKMDDGFQYWYYFTSYDNNVFLVTVFSVIKKIWHLIGFKNGEFAVVLLSIVSVNLGGYFSVRTVYNFTKKRYLTVVAFIIYALFIGLSPWIIIPYSDTYSLVITSFLLYLYTNLKIKKYGIIKKNALIGLMFFVATIGFYIKPTCVIVLMAICFMEIWSFLFVSNKVKIRQLRVLPIIIVCVLIGICINKAAIAYVHYEKDDTRRVPVTHYIMMGLNEKTDGTFYRNDVTGTSKRDSYKKKQKYNIRIIKKRLKKMGIKGYLRFQKRKMLVNYNDGTFAWGREGAFYDYAKKREGKVEKWIWSFIHLDGANFEYYGRFAQTIWITMLFLMMFMNIQNWGKYEDYKVVCVMAIVGITIFVSIFEARARYLFLYSTYYVVCFVMGVDSFIHRFVGKAKDNK